MIYLDNNATTKIDPRVLEAMMPYLTDNYANASSAHKFGEFMNKAVELARVQVAELIGCAKDEITFTSGATEAINLAIRGIAEAHSHKGYHIITVSTEHSAVLDTCRYLEQIGYDVTYLPVLSDGLIDIDDLKNAIRKDTLLVSVMFANNETGVIQPIEEIAEIVHAAGCLFMTDATQVVGKIPIDVDKLGIDLMAFSAHKFYGPKGVGVLYVRKRGIDKIKLMPLLYGGGHEKGMRSGTLNVPGIVGLGAASQLATLGMVQDAEKLGAMRDSLEESLLQIPNSQVNGSINNRMPHVSNILLKGIEATSLMAALPEIAISNGSACSSALIEPSHVLKAMGLEDEDAYCSIRLSLGKFNTPEEVELAAQLILQAATNLCKIEVPMHQSNKLIF